MITYKQYVQEAAAFPPLTRKTVDWGNSFLRKHFYTNIPMGEAVNLIKQGFDFIDGISFKIINNSEIEKNDIVVGGSYISEKNLTIIELNINPKSHYFNLKNFSNLQEELKTVILHELVHRTQALKRRLKPPSQTYVTAAMRKSAPGDPKTTLGPAAEYFGDPDEIGAYAHTLALDLLKQTKNNAKEAITILKHHHYPTPSNYLNHYLIIFKPNSPILKKLLKLTYHFLTNEEKL